MEYDMNISDNVVKYVVICKLYLEYNKLCQCICHTTTQPMFTNHSN